MLRTRREMGRLGCRICSNQFQYSHALSPISPSAPAIRGVVQTNIMTNSLSSRSFNAHFSTRTPSHATDDIWSRKGSAGAIYALGSEEVSAATLRDSCSRSVHASVTPFNRGSRGLSPQTSVSVVNETCPGQNGCMLNRTSLLTLMAIAAASRMGNRSTRAMSTGPAKGLFSWLDATSKKTTGILGTNRSIQNKAKEGILRGMDYMGTAVFALSGTVTAGTSGMDLLGCCIVGTITATGGGTVRDLLLGNSPVFWMKETEYLWMCLVTTATVFFIWSYLSERGIRDDMEILNWADAMGIGAFCCIGAQAGIRKGLSPVVCILCGMLTSSFGGVIRDVLCQRPPRILHSHAEIYASTALLGSTVYVGSRIAGFSPLGKITAGFVTGMGLRVLAFKTDLRLPTWARPFEEEEAARDEEVPGAKDS